MRTRLAVLLIALSVLGGCSDDGDSDGGDAARPTTSRPTNEFCAALSDANVGGTATGTTLSQAEFEARARKIDFDAVIGAAPAEVKDATRVYVDKVFRPLYAELARVDYDYSKVNPAVLAGAQEPATLEAAQKVGQYYQANCQ